MSGNSLSQCSQSANWSFSSRNFNRGHSATSLKIIGTRVYNSSISCLETRLWVFMMKFFKKFPVQTCMLYHCSVLCRVYCYTPTPAFHSIPLWVHFWSVTHSIPWSGMDAATCTPLAAWKMSARKLSDRNVRVRNVSERKFECYEIWVPENWVCRKIECKEKTV